MMTAKPQQARPLPWFRLYTETVDDEKLRLLAFEDRWHYIAILCCKGANIIDGTDSVDMLERKLCVKLGVQPRELSEIQRRLIEVGLLENGWHPTGWGKRQFKSDHDGRERARKSREKSK